MILMKKESVKTICGPHFFFVKVVIAWLFCRFAWLKPVSVTALLLCVPVNPRSCWVVTFVLQWSIFLLVSNISSRIIIKIHDYKKKKGFMRWISILPSKTRYSESIKSTGNFSKSNLVFAMGLNWCIQYYTTDKRVCSTTWKINTKN